MGAPWRKELVLNGQAIPASGSESSNSVLVGDGWGDFAIEGTISSATPDHSVTFFYQRSDGTNVDSVEYAIGSAVTGTTFNIPIATDGYMSYMSIVAKNAAGKETATVNCSLVMSKR